MADKPLVRAIWESWRHGPYSVTVLRRLHDDRYECQVGDNGHPLWRGRKIEVFYWELWLNHRFSGYHSVWWGRPDLSQYDPPPAPPWSPPPRPVFPEDTEPVPQHLLDRINGASLDELVRMMRSDGPVDPIFIGAAGQRVEQRLIELRSVPGGSPAPVVGGERIAHGGP